MDDKATAAKIVAEPMYFHADEVENGYVMLESAIVAALEAARRDAGAATQRTIDAAFREGYEAALRAHADTLNARTEACNVNGIIDCTGEVPVVRRVLGTFVLTADGCVWAHGAKVYWRDDPHEESIENINDDIAFFEDHGTDASGEVCGTWEKVSQCYSTPAAAKAAMEGGKA